ncbi:MAG: ATP-binding protein [Phycisphaerae bacterium]
MRGSQRAPAAGPADLAPAKVRHRRRAVLPAGAWRKDDGDLRRVSTLLAFSYEVIGDATQDGLAQRVADAARQLTGAGAAVCAFGPTTGGFETAAFSAAPGAEVYPRVELLCSAAGDLLRDLASAPSVHLTSRQLRSHPAWHRLAEEITPLHGLLAARIAGPAAAAQGMVMVVDKEAGGFTDRDDAFLRELTAVASLALRQIAERKRTERSLRLTQFAVDHAIDSIFWIGRDAGIEYVNEAACLRLGYTAQEMLAMKVSDLDPNFPAEAWTAHWEELKRRGSMTFESAHRAKDGRVIPVEITANFVEFDGREFNCAFARDITERKIVMGALRESEDRLRLAIEAAALGTWDHDLVTDRLAWSNRCKEIFGLPLDREPDYGEFLESVHDEDRERIRATIAHSHEPGGDGRFIIEYRFVLPDGSIRWIGSRGQTFFGVVDGVMRATRVIGTVSDITERKKAEEDMLKTAQELARSNRDLEQFAYVASHDLQEPLRMVTGYMKLLADNYKGRLDADADEFIGFALDGAQRMRSLIEDLLAYSRVGTRGKALGPVDSKAALDNALTDLRASIEEASAVVEVGQMPTVWADQRQLSQLFQNLVGNAIKFRRPGVRPEVHVGAVRGEGEMWQFAVKDNGIGIDPAQADRLFQIFHRLCTRNEYPGTGVGLAICKRIVERHGGRIWVESKPGEGSTFCFTLPAAPKKGDSCEFPEGRPAKAAT